MRIIYLANIRLPTEKAHGYQIVRTAAAMVEQGVQVELVVPRRRNPKLGGQDVFSYYGVTQQFPIVRLPSIDLIRGSMYRVIGPLAFWLQTWTFARSVKKYLHTATADWVYGRDELLLGQITDLPKDAKLAVELHALPSTRYSKLLDRADRIVVITHAIKGGLISQGIDAGKITVAPDAVDLQLFSSLPSRDMARQKLRWLADEWFANKKIAIYIGHSYRWKGIFTLIDSSKFLSDAWVVVLVGGLRDEVGYVKDEIIKRGLSIIDGHRRLEVIEHKDHNSMPMYLAAADVFVLPNSAKTERSRLYTSPLKLFEYLAAGRPIVASDLPSIREIVSEREVIFVKPDDPQDLARGIREAGESDQTARVNAALQLAKRFTWQGRAKIILDALAVLPKH